MEENTIINPSIVNSGTGIPEFLYRKRTQQHTTDFPMILRIPRYNHQHQHHHQSLQLNRQVNVSAVCRLYNIDHPQS